MLITPRFSGSVPPSRPQVAPPPPAQAPSILPARFQPAAAAAPAPAPPAPTPAPTPGPIDLGDGFPPADPARETVADRLHDWLANRTPRAYGWATRHVMHKVSQVTTKSVGVDLDHLLHAERTLYQLMAPSRDGYTGGSAPIFQALAEGQAAYVNLGTVRQDDAEHLTRLYSNLPPAKLADIGVGKDELTPVRQALMDRLQNGQFPAYINETGNYTMLDATGNIAGESVSSIARRENGVQGFTDPTEYYKWLVTRVDSSFRKVDPWLYAIKPALHQQTVALKQALTPSWLHGKSTDPLGFMVPRKMAQAAYHTVMGICGNGDPPTKETLSDIADTMVNLDRDLLTGTQTYLMKLMRSVSPQQRQSLFLPLARSWTSWNVVPPDDPYFSQVSPDNAPDIELIDPRSGQQVTERYDRAMALSEAVDHVVAGLGIDERKTFVGTIMDEARARSDFIRGREQRVRNRLEGAYHGIDVDGLLSGKVDGSDPNVQRSLQQLRQALHPEQPHHPMTVERAELQRHLDILDWVANHRVRYHDNVLDVAAGMSGNFGHDPYIVGEYFMPGNRADAPSPLPPVPTRAEVLGTPIAGRAPLPMSVVLEGGGGKGFAYPECMRQLKDALAKGPGQVAIDEFVGTSSGAITAGLLACGYTPEELAMALQQLDFKKFYADYLWLMGGVDSKVRGINRTGLFSTRTMYQTVTRLVSQKVNVKGRPVLFRDLPYKLKVVSTVLTTNLPDDLRRQFNIGADGQMEFSSEKTPNMDVAAAICCSASVPAFFHSPQVRIGREEPDGKGGTHLAEYRMQMMDGACVNNLPIAQASRPASGNSFLVAVPSYYQAPPSKPGEKTVELSTLDFSAADLARINTYNAQRYTEFAPHLASFAQQAMDAGQERMVLAFQLITPGEQNAPIVQGHTRPQSQHLVDVAHAAALPVMQPDAGAKLVSSNFGQPKHDYVEQRLLNALLGKEGVFHPSFRHKPQYHPLQHEAEDLSDLMIGVTAATMVAPSQLSSKLFEQKKH